MEVDPTPAGARLRRLLVIFIALIVSVTVVVTSGVPGVQADEKNKSHVDFLPVVTQPKRPASKVKSAVYLVNEKRAEAGVPPVQNQSELDTNCFEHARYMAANNVLTHEQDPDLPFASPGGEECAEHANAWLGSNREDAGWTPDHSIEGWMQSVAHRLWLLYPTTNLVGYGFFSTEADNRAAAALDVLSSANFTADEAYTGWPVKFPTDASAVPPTRYPITLQWRYFGSKPILSETRLATSGGQVIAHKANTNLPAGHKGIQIIPNEPLPANSQFTVSVSGSYEGQPFDYTWTFYSGQ
jgi:uncharacterized protein YkwD